MDERTRTRLPAESRKAQILKAAADLFYQRAYQETSMEAIAQHVGIRKASLYYYFSSKDDLLAQMQQEMIEPIIVTHQNRLADATLDSSALLLGMMTDLVSLMETHPGHIRVLLEHQRELPEPLRHKIAEQTERYREMIVSVLERGVIEGTFTVASPYLTAMAILGMCGWTYQWYRPKGEYSADEIARYFYDTLLRGIATPS